jgi:hypothetical protein
MQTTREYGQVDRATVGVLGYVTAKGWPNALAVTPYVVDGRLLVTSTLALVDKAAALRLDQRVTLTAGGLSVAGQAEVQADPTPAFFDQHIRRQELAKYPPARSLLAVPFHRTLVGWYVGRVLVWIEPDSVAEQSVSDRVTATILDEHGSLRTWAIQLPHDLDAERIPLPSHLPDGRVRLLVHEEDSDMRDLRQLTIRGTSIDGTLHVDHRSGTLTSSRSSTLDQLRTLQSLARRAGGNRDRIASWPAADTRRVAGS